MKTKSSFKFVMCLLLLFFIPNNALSASGKQSVLDALSQATILAFGDIKFKLRQEDRDALMQATRRAFISSLDVDGQFGLFSFEVGNSILVFSSPGGSDMVSIGLYGKNTEWRQIASISEIELKGIEKVVYKIASDRLKYGQSTLGQVISSVKFAVDGSKVAQLSSKMRKDLPQFLQIPQWTLVNASDGEDLGISSTDVRLMKVYTDDYVDDNVVVKFEFGDNGFYVNIVSADTSTTFKVPREVFRRVKLVD